MILEILMSKSDVSFITLSATSANPYPKPGFHPNPRPNSKPNPNRNPNRKPDGKLP